MGRRPGRFPAANLNAPTAHCRGGRGPAREPRPGQHNEVGIMSQTLELGGPLRLGDPGPLPAESESLAQSDSESAGDSRLGLVTR